MTEKYDSSNVAAGPTIASDDMIQTAAGVVPAKSSNITGNQQRDWVTQEIALRHSPTGIAFDSAANLDSINPVSSYTIPFTVSGANPIIWMSVHDNSSNGGDHIASVTYNGVPLTRIESITSGCVNLTPGFLYMLVGPSIGLHDLIVTATDPIQIQGTVVSYTGARQTGQPDAHTQNTAEFTSGGITTFLSTITDNSWVVSANLNWSLIPDSGTGVTTRTPKVNGWLGDSNGPIHPAGPYSMMWDTSHITDACKEVVQASFAPAN
jgi:hypothetical protein